MTLLGEYQALPDRTLDYNNIGRMYEATGESPRAMVIEAHIDSAHAVIRLLAKALRETLNDMSAPTFSDPRISYIEVQVTPSQLAEARALLTAVERDFKEGA